MTSNLAVGRWDDRTVDDRERFRQLFDDSYQPLLAYALRRIGGLAEAEDVVAETLTIAWRRRQDVPEGEAARLYLFGIARKLLANRRRSQQRGRGLIARLAGEGRRAAQDEIHISDPSLMRALAALSEQDREILRLAAWEELSSQEIATVLGISASGATSRLHRARRRLAAQLGELGAERTNAGGRGT